MKKLNEENISFALCRGQRPTRRPSNASEVQYMLLQFSLSNFYFIYFLFLLNFTFYLSNFCHIFGLKEKK